MAEDDIYQNKKRYERFITNLNELVINSKRTSKKHPRKKGARRKYFCKNRKNLDYFKKLIQKFDAQDLSPVRRMRLFQTLLIVVHNTKKNLKNVNRKDMDRIKAFMNTVYKSPKSRSDWVRDIRHMWKIILPEKDIHGRPDETLVPYQVRHLSSKIEKAQVKAKKDKLTPSEFRAILDYFSDNPCMQAYIALAHEGIARPQEMLYRRLKEIEYFDHHATILISDHGKEGPGIIQCIDSYPYLLRWIEKHPFKNDPEAYIFINTQRNVGEQMTPNNVNKKIKAALDILGINKPITGYSFKRNGVTERRKRGESDMEIQMAARWKSTKQLQTYDYSEQEDALRLQLKKRGLISEKKPEFKSFLPKSKTCAFCKTVNPSDVNFCSKCDSILDRKTVEVTIKKQQEIDKLKEEIDELRKEKMEMQDLKTQVSELKKVVFGGAIQEVKAIN